jgi:type II secretory pathway component GspD/PulD (secretin)
MVMRERVPYRLASSVLVVGLLVLVPIGTLSQGAPLPDPTRAVSLRYRCKFIRASEAERILIDLLNLHQRASRSDARTNTVMVTGPADKVAQARAILKRIDVGPRLVPIACPPSLKIYAVRAGTASAVAKALQQEFKSSTSYRVTAAGDSKVLVYGFLPEQELTFRLLHRLGAKGRKIKSK